MSPTAWIVALIASLLGAGAGAWLARRRGKQQVQTLEHAADRARQELLDREARAEGEQRVQDLILSTMQEGILLIDADGRTAFTNDALVSLLGVRPADAATLIPVVLREAVATARGGDTATVLAETGSPTRWLRATASPAGDNAILVVVSDVTEARRLDAIRRDFVANASHELKTPAASIQAAAETLRQAAADDPAAIDRFSRQLEREAVRLSRIVADLLDLSRLESGSDLGERVRLDALAREEVQRFEDPAREAGLRIRVQAEDVPPVRGSARDLSLLIRNLVDNAIRYTRVGGHVDVGVHVGNGTVTLTVADDGVGIPSRDLPRIFERFYRVDRARSRETGGTGLGLAIVRHVAENHDGSVRVESELGQGTTFSVELPRASTN